MSKWTRIAKEYAVLTDFGGSASLDEPSNFSVTLGEVGFDFGKDDKGKPAEVDEPTTGFGGFDLEGDIFGIKTKYLLAVAGIYFFFIK